MAMVFDVVSDSLRAYVDGVPLGEVLFDPGTVAVGLAWLASFIKVTEFLLPYHYSSR